MGAFPAGSTLPTVANWFSTAVRGLLALAPPPPPLVSPCPGIPESYGVSCAPCPSGSGGATRLCAFIDTNGDGIHDAGEPGPAWGTPLPLESRGFDDPQADPDGALVPFGPLVRVRYVRGDLYNLPPVYESGDLTGNPPWGSDPGDGDADGEADGLSSRQNKGMFVAGAFSGGYADNADVDPLDATADRPCPGGSCSVYGGDCGGFAHYGAHLTYAPAGPTGFDPYPSTAPDPPSESSWPVVPFQRDWIAGDTPNVPVIKKLLRYASSVVRYDPNAEPWEAYRLEEDAKNVVISSSATPIGGSLRDAYNYFVNSVFPQADDPAINCRNYAVVLLTDGLETCGGNPCSGGPTGKGPAGDLAALTLPESAPGSRQAAHDLDPSIRVTGVPVFVIGMGLNAASNQLKCLTLNNTNGQVYEANDRQGLKNAIDSALNFKRQANVFAAPAVPAFTAGSGDAAQIGAVVPSHLSETGEASLWSVWSGLLKSFRLDGAGLLPRARVGSVFYPDESRPNDANPLDRSPVWNASRVLGYTDPVGNLGDKAAPVVPDAGLNPAAKAPGLKVWPGRKMVWANGSGVPLARQDLLPDSGTCAGACFDDLMMTMDLSPTTDTDKRTLAQRTVQFLRGGITPGSGSRDEILNLVKPGTIDTIGPETDARAYSYWYQDDIPEPGTASDPPQFRTDGEATPKGYPHKLGDIFHSPAFVLEPPRYFQYLSLNLHDYQAFALKHAKRRKVTFVGANDGFLHAFDSGVWDRDDGGAFDDTFDLGTGREIFAYAPRGVMPGKFPSLLNFPPTPQYFVDGPVVSADVFVDPQHSGTPTAGDRVWRTVVMVGLRQGGAQYALLDVTQPDDIDAAGVIIGNKDASPGCLNGGNSSCTAGSVTGRKFPEVLWEFSDTEIPALGETWSKPALGRIRVINGANALEDRYVAIFGGGNDPTFQPGDTVLTEDQTVAPFKKATRGRALYIVDVETGKLLHKVDSGDTSAGPAVLFAPMPGGVGAADVNDDGVLDIAYIGDINGRMWRLDLTANLETGRGTLGEGEIGGFTPFLLYDASKGGTRRQPIFFEPGIVSFGAARLPVGVAFGTGNRADLAIANTEPQRFHFVIDNGQMTTLVDDDLRNVTPAGGASAQGVGPGPDGEGFFLDFKTINEKAVSTVFSTAGYLSILTFNQDPSSACAIAGSSYRYRIFYREGQRGYNLGVPATGTFNDYRESLGIGVPSAVQSTAGRDIIDSILLSGGAIDQRETAGGVRTLNQNWKEP
jgi:hypothetical protein